jgi:hypothetical protein
MIGVCFPAWRRSGDNIKDKSALISSFGLTCLTPPALPRPPAYTLVLTPQISPPILSVTSTASKALSQAKLSETGSLYYDFTPTKVL